MEQEMRETKSNGERGGKKEEVKSGTMYDTAYFFLFFPLSLIYRNMARYAWSDSRVPLSLSGAVSGEFFFFFSFLFLFLFFFL
jgi:hypothetical protein